jgi:uncharacterized protein with GYD domain
VAKYMVLFSYTADAVAGMEQHPSDRADAVTKLLEAAGGRLKSFHWMLGPYDGMLTAEVPDARAMASIALAVVGSHALKTFETYELIPHGDIAGIEQKAREVARGYQSPIQS